MNTRPRISGIHHITAVASSAAVNLAFYEQVLGLRLVKRTVNFDDPYTYHFYFGDAQGSPGTILTFFPWERLPQGQPGAGMVSATSFCVAPESMDFWVKRLSSFGIDTAAGERLGDPVIRFSDPHGLSLEIVGTDEVSSAIHWRSGPIETRHALRGFHSATAAVHDLKETEALLTDGMGLNVIAREGHRVRFQMQSRGPGRYFDVVQDPSAPQGRPGGGTVHHIAFRTRDEAEQLQWQALLRRRGIAVTDVRDRNYFRSIYYRTPGGILFEIATDPPGFTVDEPVERLGNALMLPAQYEPLRTDISQRLPALRKEMFRHIYEPAGTATDDGGTLMATRKHR